MNFLTALFMSSLIKTVFLLEKFITDNIKSSFVFISSDYVNLDDKLTFILRLNQLKVVTSPQNVIDLEYSDSYIVLDSASFLYTPNNTINTRGRFLVILQNNVTEDETKCILETFWSFYVYNVVVYVNWTMFVTWYPYHSDSNCGTVTNLVINAPKPYENKIPKYLKGCPINVTWGEMPLGIKTPTNKKDPGHLVRVLDAVGQFLDANICYLTENYFNLGAPTRETHQMIAKDVKKRYIEIVFWFGVTPVTPTSDLEMSVAYQNIFIFFVLPPRRKITSSTEVLFIFPNEVWVLILVSLLFMAVLMRSLLQTNFEDGFFQVVRLVLQGTTRKLPKNAPTRLALTFFFFYVTNLNWIYVSQLSGVMSQPSFEPKIVTVKDLAHSTKRLKFNVLYDKFLSGDVYDEIKKLRVENTEGVLFEDEIVDFVQDLNHGFISSDTRLLLFKNPDNVMVVDQDEVLKMHSYYMVRKGFPFLGRMNDALLRIIESGLLSFWVYESQINLNKTMIPDYGYVEGHLSLNQILSAFLLLSGGLATAGVVFVLELVINGTKQRPKFGNFIKQSKRTNL